MRSRQWSSFSVLHSASHIKEYPDPKYNEQHNVSHHTYPQSATHQRVNHQEGSSQAKEKVGLPPAMAPVLIPPLVLLVWVGSEAGTDEVTGSVWVFEVEIVLLFPRVTVLIG